MVLQANCIYSWSSSGAVQCFCRFYYRTRLWKRPERLEITPARLISRSHWNWSSEASPSESPKQPRAKRQFTDTWTVAFYARNNAAESRGMCDAGHFGISCSRPLHSGFVPILLLRSWIIRLPGLKPGRWPSVLLPEEFPAGTDPVTLCQSVFVVRSEFVINEQRWKAALLALGISKCLS